MLYISFELKDKLNSSKNVVFPFPYPTQVLTLAGLAGLAVGHVVEDVLHGAAVGQIARAHLAVGLFSPLALVRVQQEHQLLLDQLALLRVGRGGHSNPTHPRGRPGHTSRTQATLSVGHHTHLS